MLKYYHRRMFGKDFFLPDGMEQEFDDQMTLIDNSICSIYQDGWTDGKTEQHQERFNEKFSEYEVVYENLPLYRFLWGMVIDIIWRIKTTKASYYKAIIKNRWALLKMRAERI